MHSSPEPRSACTPNHVPKSLASAKVGNFKWHIRQIEFHTLAPVVAASAVRRSVAGAAVAAVAAGACTRAAASAAAVEPDTDIAAAAVA